MSRVLVVDDEEDVRLMVKLTLRSKGWEVDEAASGQEALERCRTGSYSAIVLDQRMPRMTGLEAGRRLRSNGDETPIVLFSAFLDPEIEEQAREAGFIPIPKDDLPRLIGTLREMDGTHPE